MAMRFLDRPRRAIDYKGLIRRSAREEDADELIEEPCIIRDEAGSSIIIYTHVQHPALEALRGACFNLKYHTGKRTLGLKSTSRIFGARPRNEIRHNFCSMASLSLEQPEEHKKILNAAVLAAEKYREFSPVVFEKHAAIVKEKILPEWTLPGTPFTSGIVNKNNPLNYHHDAGNFHGNMSAMFVFRRAILGGNLVLPELNIKFSLRDGALLLFDGQAILHGVTKINRLNESGYRYSVVYYSLEKIKNCLGCSEEIKWARQKRKEREDARRVHSVKG